MKVIDFIYCDHEPIHSGCGVYVFKEGKDIFYVGKSSGKSFVERIPAHFDLRDGGWFNTILRYVDDHRTSTDKIAFRLQVGIPCRCGFPTRHVGKSLTFE